MKESQYTQEYIDETLQALRRGQRPYSVGTFLVYRLRGAAHRWRDRYARSLCRSLESRGWVLSRSKRGGQAYIPRPVI